MTAKLVVVAQNLGDPVTYLKGDIVSILPEGSDFGNAEKPPDYVRLTISDVTRSQVHKYVNTWTIDYIFTLVNQNAQGWRYRVEVDPIYISASDVGKDEMKAEMQTYIEGAEPDSMWDGCNIVSFTSNSMTVDIPKNGTFQTEYNMSDGDYLKELRDDFTDKFKTVLNIRRYYFKPASVDWVIGNDPDTGAYTATHAQALNHIVDRLDE